MLLGNDLTSLQSSLSDDVIVTPEISSSFSLVFEPLEVSFWGFECAFTGGREFGCENKAPAIYPTGNEVRARIANTITRIKTLI